MVAAVAAAVVVGILLLLLCFFFPLVNEVVGQTSCPLNCFMMYSIPYVLFQLLRLRFLKILFIH